jgi:hypothetical protein
MVSPVASENRSSITLGLGSGSRASKRVRELRSDVPLQLRLNRNTCVPPARFAPNLEWLAMKCLSG